MEELGLAMVVVMVEEEAMVVVDMEEVDMAVVEALEDMEVEVMVVVVLEEVLLQLSKAQLVHVIRGNYNWNSQIFINFILIVLFQCM